MPLFHGSIRAIQTFDHPKQRDTAEVAWRAWCKEHDKRLWPDHLAQWGRIKGAKR